MLHERAEKHYRKKVIEETQAPASRYESGTCLYLNSKSPVLSTQVKRRPVLSAFRTNRQFAERHSGFFADEF
jgi:hypothetical protein